MIESYCVKLKLNDKCHYCKLNAHYTNCYIFQLKNIIDFNSKEINRKEYILYLAKDLINDNLKYFRITIKYLYSEYYSIIEKINLLK